MNRKLESLEVALEHSRVEVVLPQDVDTIELFARMTVFYTKTGHIIPVYEIKEYFPVYKKGNE